MQTDLAERVCLPCRGDVPPLTSAQITPLLEQVFGWHVDAGKKIHKSYQFEDFVGAVDFVNQVAEVAEEQGHHPDLLVRWGEVQVFLWTHKIDGLNEADFIMAAKIDRIFGTRRAIARNTARTTNQLDITHYAVTGEGWTINPDHDMQWPPTIADQTPPQAGEISSAKAELTWRQQGWVSTRFSVEVTDGASWFTVETFDEDSPPPADLTQVTYNLSAVLDIADKLNSAHFRWRSPATGAAGADGFTISIASIRLVVNGS